MSPFFLLLFNLFFHTCISQKTTIWGPDTYHTIWSSPSWQTANIGFKSNVCTPNSDCLYINKAGYIQRETDLTNYLDVHISFTLFTAPENALQNTDFMHLDYSFNSIDWFEIMHLSASDIFQYSSKLLKLPLKYSLLDTKKVFLRFKNNGSRSTTPSNSESIFFIDNISLLGFKSIRSTLWGPDQHTQVTHNTAYSYKSPLKLYLTHVWLDPGQYLSRVTNTLGFTKLKISFSTLSSIFALEQNEYCLVQYATSGINNKTQLLIEYHTIAQLNSSLVNSDNYLSYRLPVDASNARNVWIRFVNDAGRVGNNNDRCYLSDFELSALKLPVYTSTTTKMMTTTTTTTTAATTAAAAVATSVTSSSTGVGVSSSTTSKVVQKSSGSTTAFSTSEIKTTVKKSNSFPSKFPSKFPSFKPSKKPSFLSSKSPSYTPSKVNDDIVVIDNNNNNNNNDNKKEEEEEEEVVPGVAQGGGKLVVPMDIFTIDFSNISRIQMMQLIVFSAIFILFCLGFCCLVACLCKCYRNSGVYQYHKAFHSENNTPITERRLESKVIDLRLPPESNSDSVINVQDTVPNKAQESRSSSTTTKDDNEIKSKAVDKTCSVDVLGPCSTVEDEQTVVRHGNATVDLTIINPDVHDEDIQQIKDSKLAVKENGNHDISITPYSLESMHNIPLVPITQQHENDISLMHQIVKMQQQMQMQQSYQLQQLTQSIKQNERENKKLKKLLYLAQKRRLSKSVPSIEIITPKPSSLNDDSKGNFVFDEKECKRDDDDDNDDCNNGASKRKFNQISQKLKDELVFTVQKRSESKEKL